MLERVAEGNINTDNAKANAEYYSSLAGSLSNPKSQGALGAMDRYIAGLAEASALLKPYAGQVIAGTQNGPGGPQTYFSATQAQQDNPYINSTLGFIPKVTDTLVPNGALRDEERLERFMAQNGSVEPDYTLEEFVLGNKVASTLGKTTARVLGEMPVKMAGEVEPTRQGFISVRQITEQGMPAKLSADDLTILSKLDTLPNTTTQGEARELVSHNFFIRNGYEPLPGKCGSNCFDGVYLKDGRVYVVEVKPLNENGSISLNSSTKNLPTQMSPEWIESAINRLSESGSATLKKTAAVLEAARDNGTMVKIVAGINKNGMTLVKLK